MKFLLKVVLYPILLSILLIIGYIFVLWVSTIHDTVTVGSKYGFTIGTSKQKTFNDVMSLKKEYPDFVIYTCIKQSNCNDQLIKVNHDINELVRYDQWRLYLDDNRESSNSIRLSFKENKLSNLYRHRQYYEFP